MASISKTLKDYLTQPNPTVNNRESLKGSNTKSGRKGYKDFNNYREWEEFTYETLLQTVFSRTIENDVTFDLPDVSQFISSSNLTALGPSHSSRLTDITDEESLKDLLKQWNKSIVCAALIAAQRDHRAEERISMALGAKAYIKDVDGTMSRFRPDWAGIQDAQSYLVSMGGKEQKVRFNILPGDAKLSTKWTSENFKKNQYNRNLRMPVQQLLTYCECAKTRYGYLLLQEELVVFRYSYKLNSRSKDSDETPTVISQQDKLESSKKKEDAERVLEMKSIPWGTENEGGRNG